MIKSNLKSHNLSNLKHKTVVRHTSPPTLLHHVLNRILDGRLKSRWFGHFTAPVSMYQGLDKGNGGIVGSRGMGGVVDVADACDTTSVDESLVCTGINENGDEVGLLVVAKLKEDGDIEWVRGEDQAKIWDKTISMSQMTSMIRDNDRNTIYNEGIRRLIGNFISTTGSSPIVLDIGAGTGLLSMMSVQHGADKTIGCEMFAAMANVATNVTAENGMSDSIHIIPSKSTDVDLPIQPDIIVSELLDSALLGEAVLLSHADAIQRLVSHNSGVPIHQRVLPHSADIYATLIESQQMRDMVNISELKLGFSPFRDPYAHQCTAGWNCLPLHWSELELRGGRCLSDAVNALHVEMFHADEASLMGSNCVEVSATSAGIMHGVLLWWNLYLLSPDLDPERTVVYSTAPGAQNWQDHWVQVVYPLSTPMKVDVGDKLEVTVSHDGLKLSADVNKVSEVRAKRSRSDEFGEGMCTCGWHMLCNADRIHMLHDPTYITAMHTAIATAISNIPDNSVVLDIGDGSLFSMYCGKIALNRNKPLSVFSLERKMFSRMFHAQLTDATENNIDNVTILDEEEYTEFCAQGTYDIEEDSVVSVEHIALLLCECFFYQMHTQPIMAALSYLYARRALQHKMDVNTMVLPRKVLVMCAVFELADLHVSHGIVESTAGFSHQGLDCHQREWYTHYYPYKLGSYRKRRLSDVTVIATIDYTTDAGVFAPQVRIPLVASGTANCVGIWIDLELNEGNVFHLYRDEDFPLYAKTLVKFLQTPVKCSESGEFHCVPCFSYGESTIEFDFACC